MSVGFRAASHRARGKNLGISLYTSPDGELQRRHRRDNDVIIVAKSPRDLLEAMITGVPSSVFLDGERIAQDNPSSHYASCCAPALEGPPGPVPAYGSNGR